LTLSESVCFSWVEWSGVVLVWSISKKVNWWTHEVKPLHHLLKSEIHPLNHFRTWNKQQGTTFVS
jgi:hypothetical protein